MVMPSACGTRARRGNERPFNRQFTLAPARGPFGLRPSALIDFRAHARVGGASRPVRSTHLTPQQPDPQGRADNMNTPTPSSRAAPGRSQNGACPR